MTPSSQAFPHTYRLLLTAVVIVPMALAVGFGWWNWERVTRETVVRMDQRVDMLYENAERLLQTDQQLLDRMGDRVAQMSWPEIIAHKADLVKALSSITAGVGEVKGASLVDASGNVQVVMVHRDGPVLQANVTDREYFQAAQQRPGLVFDGPFKGRVTGKLSVAIAQRLTSPEGKFRGVAVLIVEPNEIASYWRSLVEPGDAMNLVRDDGTILARWPKPVTGQRERVSALALSMRAKAERGQFEQPNSVFDGVARRVAFRKLSPFPLSVSYAIDRENLVRDWYPMTLAFLAFAGFAALALFLIARAVVRSAVALRESQDRYRALYDYTPVPMHACDIDGNIIAVSERWLDLMGYTREEVIGRSIADFRTPEQATVFRGGGWKKSVEAGGVRDIERKYRRKSGELIDVLISSRAEHDRDGRFRRMAVVVIDVTEKKRIESTLHQVQKMEAVGQLTGGVAHDFNNLLTVIGGNLDMLRLRLKAKADNPDLFRLVEGALRGAKRASTLTQRLLAFSRRQPLDPKPVNPNRLVSGMSDMLGRTLGETIAIETVLGGGVWGVEVDENQLENTLLNLAVNARDAMPKGGKLTIETSNAYLDESYAQVNEDVTPGQYVMIAVSDTGIGMSEDIIAKAFEPFFTTKTVGHGTGLGLSQVYGFLKQSGGHVKIYSEVGHGTTIKLYLPRLAAEDAQEAAAEPQRAVAAASGKTVLVVEDDDDVRTFAADVLSQLGHRVLTAADGTAALRLVEDNPDIDLLFTDVGLPPPYNGRTLSEAVLKLRPGLRVLFTTGYARNAIVHHGRLDAGVDLIVKPYTQADLTAKIVGVLEGEPAGLRVPSDIAVDGPADAGA